MFVTLERLNELLDDIELGGCKAVSVRQLAEKTRQPTTLVRLRALERGLEVERDMVLSRNFDTSS
jgi:hypothetical protein